MELDKLCKAAYASCSKIKSQKDYIDKLFEAAGEKTYISDSYKKYLLTGKKAFTENQKMPLRNKDNMAALIAFFKEYIDDAGAVLSELGIPEKDGEADLDALAYALAKQLKLIIDSSEEDVEDIVALEYQGAKNNNSQMSEDATIKPLYIGDSVNVFHDRKHEIQSYDKVVHSWELCNTGKIKWAGRKLVYKRKPKDRPEATPSVIDVPDAEPGKSIKITTTIDGRGFDGITNCIWEMQDAAGQNCFPQRESLFSVTIDAKYKRK
jgi:hypothetical protein